ncbi:MAG: hypothetical protein GT601_17215 [Acidaminobacter sp.]|uniref:MoaD/ThiS family protein n=1 Tax=Acidaminobacter sp. TaxID=1872102 RepID=UPI0013820E80|nr:MoaD/ThiS family protein [Acidaminobacter sp.]MZQ99408.1 hypothetical protein [Acidaminobacter sp.]
MTITIRNASYINLKSNQVLSTTNNGATILGLLTEYKVEESVIRTVTFLVNGIPAKYHDILKDGDEVVVIPVIVGG